MAEQTRNNEQNEQQDLSQILQVRREKLKALQDEGHDPFHITKYDVTHHAQEIKDSFDVLEGTEVTRCRPPDEQARHGQGLLLRPAG